MGGILGKWGGGGVLEWGGARPQASSTLASSPIERRSGLGCYQGRVLDGLKLERIIMKLERLGLPVPSRGSLYNKIAYIRRTLTQYSSEFSTKDLGG